MPEGTEAITEGKHVDKFVTEQPPGHRRLRAVLIDATNKEAGSSAPGSLAAEGHVFELESSADVLRGQTHNQTGVYPPMYSDPLDIPIHCRGLILCGVALDPRNVILKFQDNRNAEAWVQIQLLKHTVVQIYTQEDWKEAICQVPRQSRGFKVGVAFEFKKHVMAFLTLDLLIQVHWSTSRTGLPAQNPDVYLDFRLFLSKVVKWMTEQRGDDPYRPKARTGNALSAVKSSGTFPGVGVYTASEVFHRAEAEVFDSPSRTARLCAALYHFMVLAHTDVWKMVESHMHGYVLAVEREDRLKYAKMLHVYGKEQATVSDRFKNLWNDYQAFISRRLNIPETWTRSPDNSPFDVFEPTLISHALRLQKLNLGSLIFGKDHWQRLCRIEDLPESCVSDDNPLRSSRKAKPRQSRQLKAMVYDQTRANDPPLGVTIQNTGLYTVGPLDYCAIGRLVRGRAGTKLLVCDNDPREKIFYAQRLALAKATAKLITPNAKKQGLSKALKRRVLKDLPISSNILPSSPLEPERPAKRRRLSADKHIALDVIHNSL
ncbi:hypothetical protein CVT26_013424 [Gymnopilus dilepis]|uniref:Uncharacterized protein n=1 Tax=Gymnopilus dilepis TaxID=231916 RepID=A0A409VV15_9AGAR|nr:hypothetical protein CVT26_013424 [Gymnopilus dilepis]